MLGPVKGKCDDHDDHDDDHDHDHDHDDHDDDHDHDDKFARRVSPWMATEEG